MNGGDMHTCANIYKKTSFLLTCKHTLDNCWVETEPEFDASMVARSLDICVILAFISLCRSLLLGSNCFSRMVRGAIRVLELGLLKCDVIKEN